MKVLIIEDEAPAFRRLQRILEELSITIQLLEVIDSVQDSVNWLKNHQAPDLIFMDIQLADGLSFEIFEQVEVNTPVIFTTAYNEYTLDAFKVNSIDYLLKPIDEKLLKQSIEKYQKLHHQTIPQDLKAILRSINPERKTYKKRFLVKSRKQLLSIPCDKIAYFYTDSGVVFMKTQKGEKHHLDYTLDEIEAQVDPREFFRLNRQFVSCIAGIQSVESIDKGKLLVHLQPKSDQIVIVSRDKASSFKKWLGDE